uniref:Uncharacterized protein n=1 Tax=Lactuca sativa TaxID=4236 RepID=A0A9R1V9B1_LACSA|nr:hypothetical protein LSAT_V11C500273460 [Lactuca sativa]
MGEFQRSIVCRIASLSICCFVSFLSVGVFHIFVYYDDVFLCFAGYIVHLCGFCCQSAYSGFTNIPWFWLQIVKKKKTKKVHQLLKVGVETP